MPQQSLMTDCQAREQENRGRRERARKSLSGSCAGDYLTATTVKEKPRRQPTSSRLPVASSHGERGLRPPVCAHDPLNGSRALTHRTQVCVSHFTSISGSWIVRPRTFRNPINGVASLHHTRSARVGTSRRLAAFR